ncbi:hypothetical protein [Brucella rhizosphaerae]|uniref:hypothetical protein n=1 Tax=Brucella rhizosphaerae TaxID=571254 RepID=UPI0012687A20|nr:hypothetical protein [Brucella rhizosphaerae]
MHQRESFAVRGRAERRRLDENGGGQTGLAAVRQIWTTVITHAACESICAMFVRHVMAGAVAGRGSSLFLVDGVSGGTGVCRDLQNQGADGKQQDADRKLAQSAASCPASNSRAPVHAPPSFPVAREARAMSRSRRAPPDTARPPR